MNNLSNPIYATGQSIHGQAVIHGGHAGAEASADRPDTFLESTLNGLRGATEIAAHNGIRLNKLLVKLNGGGMPTNAAQGGSVAPKAVGLTADLGEALSQLQQVLQLQADFIQSLETVV